IAVSNGGPSTATRIALTDPLPAGGSAPGVASAAAPCGPRAGRPRAAAPGTLPAQPFRTLPGGAQLTHPARAPPAETDTNPANNASSVVSTVGAAQAVAPPLGTFTRIVDGTTPIPGGAGNFGTLSPPGLSGDFLAFDGSGPAAPLNNAVYRAFG